MKKLLFCLLFPTTWLIAQNPIDTSNLQANPTSSSLSWFSVIVAAFVILVLFSGILVQKRWKDNR